jgi:exo-poly-alpha-galacturonosidase
VAAATGDNNNLIILVTLMTFMLAIMGVSYKMLKEK